jgi:uncharacterized protein (DUF1786 family)
MINPLRQNKTILAVDVGAGTQDILVYDPVKEPENNLKFVLPSQTQILAKRISKIDDDLLITGEIMGGGPITMAILNHLKKGHQVVMTETSGKTVRDDLNEVREEGITIVKENEAAALDHTRIVSRDVDLEFVFNLVSQVGAPQPDFIGVAVQDHGFEKDKSDRAFRFEKIKEILEKGAVLEDFLYTSPPVYYTRMNAVLRDLKKGFEGGVAVMDSKFAAISGALHGIEERPCLCVDVGNGHTMIAVVDNGITGVLEHHTHSLTNESLTNYMTRLAQGTVENDEVFNDDGHGCYIKEAPGIEEIKRIMVSGPNRKILQSSDLELEFANPFGDVMMTGPVGLVDLVKTKYF